jgi:hypothetical protein
MHTSGVLAPPPGPPLARTDLAAPRRDLGGKTMIEPKLGFEYILWAEKSP